MLQNRIETNYTIMLGKPVIVGTRITVELILRKLSQGASVQDVMQMYPGLIEKDINACLQYAADIIANDEVIA